MQMPYIILVLLFITHQLIFIFYFFSSTHFPPPLWMVDATFIFILLFISSYFRSAWHPFSCFILRMVYFVLSCVTSLGPTHFPSSSSHTVHTFFLNSCTRYLPHNAVKYTLTEPPASKMHVHTPSTANAFWVTTLKIDDRCYDISCKSHTYISILHKNTIYITI